MGTDRENGKDNTVQECYEEVERDDTLEPCNRPAVGYRIDPTWGSPYPVCRKHLRADIYVPPYSMVAERF